jgi:alpha-L-rhamnosidase
MWIIRDCGTAENLPVFYRQFKINKKLERCLIKISALGIFRIKINGFEIDDYFMPGWTNYNKYVNLCEYDLTEHITDENLIEVTVAEGWYSGRLGYNNKNEVYGKEKALYAVLSLKYKDGSQEQIETDGSWKAGSSNIVASSFFDGEVIDARHIAKEIEQLPSAGILDCDISFEEYMSPCALWAILSRG